jgi:hypothetical protein
MQTNAKAEDLSGKEEVRGFKRAMLIIAVIFLSIIVVIITAIFSWEWSVVEMVFLLAIMHLDEIKKKMIVWFDVFRKRTASVIMLGLFLGVAMASTTVTWLRYLAGFVFFITALALYKDYKREQYEEALMDKTIKEIDEDGYSS